MMLKKVDPVFRDLWLAWLGDVEKELMTSNPDTERILRSVQMLIDALTPFPDVLKAIKEPESVKEDVLDLQN